jgi:hypothetical protein
MDIAMLMTTRAFRSGERIKNIVFEHSDALKARIWHCDLPVRVVTLPNIS